MLAACDLGNRKGACQVENHRLARASQSSEYSAWWNAVPARPVIDGFAGPERRTFCKRSTWLRAETHRSRAIVGEQAYVILAIGIGLTRLANLFDARAATARAATARAATARAATTRAAAARATTGVVGGARRCLPRARGRIR